MVKVINESTVSRNLPSLVDSFLQDFAQVYGKISYHDIVEFGDKWETLDKANQTVIIKLIRSAKRIMKDYRDLDMYEISEESPEFKKICDQIVRTVKSLKEDTVRKSNGKWTNRGDDGTEHGEFDTKKQADAQRKAMFANGYKGESLVIKDLNDNSKGFLKFINTGLSTVSKILGSDNLISGDGFDLIERDDIKSDRQVSTKSETFYNLVEFDNGSKLVYKTMNGWPAWYMDRSDYKNLVEKSESLKESNVPDLVKQVTLDVAFPADEDWSSKEIYREIKRAIEDAGLTVVGHGSEVVDVTQYYGREMI